MQVDISNILTNDEIIKLLKPKLQIAIEKIDQDFIDTQIQKVMKDALSDMYNEIYEGLSEVMTDLIAKIIRQKFNLDD